MELVLIVIAGLALSMDSLALSLIISLTAKKVSWEELKLPLFFGVAHTIMIIGGYLLSEVFLDTIQSFDHWIAFVLLSFIGIKMISHSSEKQEPIHWNGMKNPLILSLATSMDALALGITFKILEQNLLTTSAIIGAIVIVVSYTGIMVGHKLQFLKPRYNYIIGGVVLFAIGMKILLKHVI